MNMDFFKSTIKILGLLLVYLILLAAPSFAANNKINSIDWDNNTLVINTKNKVEYTEARLKDPDRLVIDILNCSINDKDKITNAKTKLGESVSISETATSKVRIVFLGESSINRKAYLTNNEKSLIIKIARIDSSFPDEVITEEIEEVPVEKLEDVGEIKDINIYEDPEETEITISTDKSVKYNTYRLKDPERLAVDLLNILPPKSTLPYPEKTTLISGIRIGSAASGIEATRVVIDLARENLDIDIGSNLLGNKLKIKLKVKQETEEQIAKAKLKVVIDPGHGGYDTGASYGGFNEKDINLIVSEKLKKYLEEKGLVVFLTREDDSFISLAERNDITNSIMPDIFISIHANALKTSSAIRGVETYYWTPQSQKLAYLTHNAILKEVQVPDHYIRQARFYVIKYTSVPAILVEMGFMTNNEDRRLLTSSTTQDKYSKAIGDSILRFLGVEPETKSKVSKNN